MKLQSEPVRLAYGESQRVPAGILAEGIAQQFAPRFVMRSIECIARSASLEENHIELCLSRLLERRLDFCPGDVRISSGVFEARHPHPARFTLAGEDFASATDEGEGTENQYEGPAVHRHQWQQK
jgi:hypothetical protein